MRGSEISAVGVWGVSMSMRVRHGLRARGALVIFCLPAAHGPEQGREISTTVGLGWEWGAAPSAWL